MIQKISNYSPPIKALFRLANTVFQASPFRHACEQFASFNESSSDVNLWFYSVNGPSMIVGLDETQAIRFAVLSVCWWVSFLPSQHPNRASFEAEKAEFDRLYALELESVIGELGPPHELGQDKDNHAHRWAYWNGKSGLLILQQSAYDPQFGFDINYWLHPWTDGMTRPTSPFIDWLFGVSPSSESGMNLPR